jgi:hypothetical protein
LTSTQSVLFGGGMDVFEVLSFDWQNMTYSKERSLAQARNYAACALITEDDDEDEDRLDNDKTPKFVVSSGTNGLIILIINTSNCIFIKNKFIPKRVNYVNNNNIKIFATAFK